MVQKEKIVIGIGGFAGAGIMEAGNLLAKYALSNGLYAFVSSEYPSLIRGGHNFSTVNINSQKINALSQGLDLLIALNEETIQLHRHELRDGSAVIYDSDQVKIDRPLGDKITLHGIPLTSIAKESGGPDIVRNTVALGAAVGLINGDFFDLEQILKQTFAKKGDQIIDMNVKAALKGHRYIHGQHDQPFGFTLQHQDLDPNKILMNGNDAVSIGAIRAGLKFAAIYPMTPITSILDYLAAKQADFNLVVKEPEDEISAIIMAIGASYTGARSLTATSGGGFCLMTEGLGMAGIAEIPLVIIEGMRSGPSTAMPTKTEQSDLDFVLYSGHGEFPRVVITPGDVTECFTETFNAFNIADKFQLPVIIITDKYLASSLQTIDSPEAKDLIIDRGKIGSGNRYASSPDGISARALPGTADSLQHASSYEHDEVGHDTDDPQIRNQMMEKRMQKLDAVAESLPEPVLYGPEDADITIFGWGSNKGIVLDALEMLKADNIKANYLHLLYVSPFPAFQVATVFDKAKNRLIVENNYTGQMTRYICAKTGRRFKNKLLKYDGMPFMPEEIVAKVKEIFAVTATPAAKTPATATPAAASNPPAPQNEPQNIVAQPIGGSHV